MTLTSARAGVHDRSTGAASRRLGIGRPSPDRSPDHADGGASGDPAGHRRRVDLAILLTAALVYTTLPSFIDIELGGRLPFAENSTGPVVATALGDRLRTLVAPLPYLVFIVILVRSLGIGSNRIGAAALFAAFCAVISLSSLIAIGDATFAFRDVAVIVASVWLISPQRADCVVFARFGVGIAAVSLLLAASGARGWMADGAGAGKGILTDRLLAGPFSQMNVLGMALAVCLPLTLLLSTRLSRCLGFGVVALAFVLTSSRTSLFAAVVAFAVYLVICAVRGRLRLLLTGAAVVGSLVAIAALPVMTDDPEAFTDRGRIWITTVDLLDGHWLFGLGISAFSVDGPITRAGDMPAAWHGHNILLTSLAMGGVFAAGLFLLLFLLAIRNAAAHVYEQPALVWCGLTLLLIGLAETPVRFDTFDGAAWMTWTVFATLLFLPGPQSDAAAGEPESDHAPGRPTPAGAQSAPSARWLPVNRTTHRPYYRDAEFRRRARQSRGEP